MIGDHPQRSAAGESSIDPVSLYLREMSIHPLLTMGEEQGLAQEIEAGAQAASRLEEIEQHDANEMTEAELLERALLLRAVQLGKTARERFIEANLPLVVSIAKRYRGHGLNLLDLVQEGNCGLLCAVDKFDYRLGYRFSTYATWWIRQAIGRALMTKARTIRLPANVAQKVNRQKRVRRSLLRTLGREPTFSEIAAAVHSLERNQSSTCADSLEESQRTNSEVVQHTSAQREIWMLHMLSQDPLSLDCPLHDTPENTLSDLVVDDTVADPFEILSQRALVEEIEDLLSWLSERERYVLARYFGLEDGSERSLAAIARNLNLSRERVRQIQAAALRKLRWTRRLLHSQNMPVST